MRKERSFLSYRLLINNSTFLLLSTLFLFFSSSQVIASIGFANTTGGDGGTVYTVTTLEDADPAPNGSLRKAVEASGKRKIIFAVSGWIDLVKTLSISNPEITINGNTAPNKGIGLRTKVNFPNNTPLVKVNTNDVIIQYIRLRPGTRGYSVDVDNYSSPGFHETDAILVCGGCDGSKAENIWLDHIDASAGNDGNVEIWGGALGVNNVTVSNSYIFQSPRYSTHSNVWVWNGYHWVSTFSHSMGSLVGYGAYNISFINNVFAHNGDRLPLFQDSWNIELINNLIYNTINSTMKLSIAGQVAGDPSGEWKVNMIGNRILNNGLNTNQSTGNTPRYILFSQSSSFNIFLKNNISQHRPNNSLPDSDAYYPGSSGTLVGSAHNFNIPESETVVLDTDEKVISLLNSTGVTLPETDILHDQIRQDIINALAGNPTGTVIDNITDSDYPNLDLTSVAPTLTSAATSISTSGIYKPTVKLTQTTTGQTFVETGQENLEAKVAEFSGSATAGAKIKIIITNTDGIRIPGITTTNDNGTWSWKPPYILSAGEYTATFTAQDKKGNTGTTTLDFTVDEKGESKVTQVTQEETEKIIEEETIVVRVKNFFEIIIESVKVIPFR
ncbi:MAG: Pectate lyase [Candidatus Woesebacteria bacterium GW2011_GWB1_43_14]|uniref:Pectate lyase n=1 Tax=Candidatus Woesebacteria bacterium GW2011_GWB1_43_14 TaxID=1618578 RepID=A0A0G1DN64_9BACT|nr:MAG: Pectate lyase [Candidatus Woesebacteria bacterium GW2011_GWA1_39_11b]KKS78275.1 MAG: Pectate lyase [Candidatus Woesebacteria bacterium GW2011_GWC1_42_9]KKS99012.1 MAG: Pectate lyase [Candidatus Woesebacteria bacterium GW2011_GWB1_43_14]